MDRAYSAYKHTHEIDIKSKYKTSSFEDGLRVERDRMNNERLPILYFYKSVGFYYEQVKAYMENFSNVKVLLYDDLKVKPNLLMKELFKFLEVDERFNVNTKTVQNVSPPMNNSFQRILFSKSLRDFVSPVFCTQ